MSPEHRSPALAGYARGDPEGVSGAPSGADAAHPLADFVDLQALEEGIRQRDGLIEALSRGGATGEQARAAADVCTQQLDELEALRGQLMEALEGVGRSRALIERAGRERGQRARGGWQG
ncbi:MAG: hypothetical protein HY791_05125 [Deltaproteobacteria bacterium]|nr:hypothetical protein [Deltaproteobacteria bacterium]